MVTGANKGIGKEIARQLAGLGYQVFLGSRDETRGQKAVDELRDSGLKDVHLVVIDVTSDDSVKAAVESVSKQVSALDVLVNNAGIMPALTKSALEETMADVYETYEVNVFGVVRTIQGFVELIKKSEHGRIVNVSSGLGSLSRAIDPHSAIYKSNALSYASSKAALNMITISYAKALAEFGIKVNAVCPGFTATDLNKHKGAQSAEIGATSSITMATIGDDGPTGTFCSKNGTIPW